MSDPRLSVIIASYNSRDTIGSCLRSLREQGDTNSFEVIVVNSSRDGTGEFLRQSFPEVRLFHFDERKFCGDARNIGIAEARGGIVAFIDADCVAPPGWVEAVLRAHESDHLAIGGAIANGNTESLVGWAAYFTEFSKWMPGTPGKMMEDIAGANMSYKAAAFDEFGSFITGTYCSDTEFHWRMEKSGRKLLFNPSTEVSHCSIEEFGSFLAHEVFHGRCFARVRSRACSFPAWKRSAYALLMPLVAIKLMAEIVLENLVNRIYLKYFLFSLPLVVLGVASWSLGELLGYLQGGGK